VTQGPFAFPADVQAQIDSAITILRRDGIVAYPTDTVFGLGARMSSVPGVQHIFRTKRRPPVMALPLLVAEMADILRLATEVPPLARRLIEAFMPGQLTLVLSASPTVPPLITANEDTVAVRIPDHPVPIALIRGIGEPLVGTSANLTGWPSPVTAAQVHHQLGAEVDLIIDDGQPCSGDPSTIVDVTCSPPVVLREGMVSIDAIEQVYADFVAGGEE